MRIKANQNLYRNILIVFNGLIVFMGSLGYFLGFDVNANSLLFYAIFLMSTFALFFIIFLYTVCCVGVTPHLAHKVTIKNQDVQILY